MVLAPAAQAHKHRGFFEVAAGAHTPLAGEQYQEMFGPSPAFTLRGGAYRPPPPGGRNAFALEFGFDWANMVDDVPDQVGVQTYSFDEFRCLFGGRWMHYLKPDLHLYLRAAGGIEVLSQSGTMMTFGKELNASDSYAGVAAQLGVGGSMTFGKVNVGLEISVPWSSHSDNGPSGRYELDTSYDALSVDFLLTLSTRR
jgi:hypothetical protein